MLTLALVGDAFRPLRLSERIRSYAWRVQVCPTYRNWRQRPTFHARGCEGTRVQVGRSNVQHGQDARGVDE